MVMVDFPSNISTGCTGTSEGEQACNVNVALSQAMRENINMFLPCDFDEKLPTILKTHGL
jgi:hypothetical protein